MRLDHVGLPVLPEDHQVVIDGLVTFVGAEVIGRGASAVREATWLRIDHLEVHVISNAHAPRVTRGATFSPHLSLSVDDISRSQEVARSLGFTTWEAGTLADVRQLWVQLADSFVIELQQGA